MECHYNLAYQMESQITHKFTKNVKGGIEKFGHLFEPKLIEAINEVCKEKENKEGAYTFEIYKKNAALSQELIKKGVP